MRKIVFLLLLIASSISLFAGTVDTNNNVTKVSEGKYMRSVYPEHPIKSNKAYGKKVVNEVTFALDCYLTKKSKQYVITLGFQYGLLVHPGYLPTDSKLRLKCQSGQTLVIEPLFVKNEDSKTCGYYEVTEEQLKIICRGVYKASFDMIVFDGNEFISEKSLFDGHEFSKKMGKAYEKITKKIAKWKIVVSGSNNNLALLYHGYKYNPYLYSVFLTNNNISHSTEAWNYYLTNESEISSQYNAMMLEKAIEVTERNTAQREHQRQIEAQESERAFQTLMNTLQKKREQEYAQQQVKQKQQAEMEASRARQRAQAKAKEEAKQREELARIYGGSNSLVAQMEAEKNRSQNRSMGTSDLAQYNAARMSDATYGSAATDRALAQQRQYDAQQNQRIQAQQRQYNSQQQAQVQQRQYNSQQQVQVQQRQINQQRVQSQQSYAGDVENAVMASGAHVQIKVNGSQVTAYSLGNNLMGPEWNGVVPAATVQDTSSPISQASSNIASRYAYQASVRGLGMVYWGTPTRRVINDAPNGTPMKAVTEKGETLTIMVNGNNVVAYASGVNQASDIQWHTAVPNAVIKETSNSFDHEFATRFKYKAYIPGIGLVYF